ncbi:hypothetical protein [Desulfitobacterium dehalogenans]|nr:hypothetical protein [Desulfitobacterium dehalogenans]
MGGWKRPVSNPTPLQPFREECLPARLESVLCLKAKSLGCLSDLSGADVG